LKISFTYIGEEDDYNLFLEKLAKENSTLKSFFNEQISNYINPPKPTQSPSTVVDSLLIELALESLEQKYKKLKVNSQTTKGNDYIYIVEATKILLTKINNIYAKNLLANYKHDEALNLVKNTFF